VLYHQDGIQNWPVLRNADLMRLIFSQIHTCLAKIGEGKVAKIARNTVKQEI